MNAIGCVEHALTALDVVNAAIDVMTGADYKVPTALFNHATCFRCTFRHSRICGYDCIDIAYVMPGSHDDIATAQGSNTFKKVAEVHPPGCRSNISQQACTKVSSRIHIAAAV